MGKRYLGPALRKGQLVRTIRTTNAWRPLTQEEINAWYEHFHAECRAGREVWHDSAGESRLAPQDQLVVIPAGTVCEVIRARVAARYGYSTVPGCCVVSVPSLGVSELFMSRRQLEATW